MMQTAEALQVRRTSVAELAAAPNLADLVQAYAAESANPALGPAVLDVPAYGRLEAAGMAHFLGAWRAERLIGLLILITTPVPHWGSQIIASAESFFVHAEERHGGAGRELRTLAEAVAREAGACGVFISAPSGGALARVLPHWGYEHTNSVFFREIQ